MSRLANLIFVADVALRSGLALFRFDGGLTTTGLNVPLSVGFGLVAAFMRQE